MALGQRGPVLWSLPSLANGIDEGDEVTEFDQLSADSVVRCVTEASGALSVDEVSVVYGAAAALERFSPDRQPEPSIIAGLVQAVGCFRSAPCDWCGGDVTKHGIDIDGAVVEVRCLKDSRHWPVDQWALGPAPTPPDRMAVAVLCWLMLPLATAGLLSCVMPLVAGVMRKNRAWLAAAGPLFLCVAAAFGMPDSLGGFFLLVAWVAGSAYGWFQIKPWLAGFPQVVALPDRPQATPAEAVAARPRYRRAPPNPTPPAYKPGDVVNDHILGTDNVWHPLQAHVQRSVASPYPGVVARVHVHHGAVRAGRRTSHGLHLILSILTGGLWIPVWIIVTLANLDG